MKLHFLRRHNRCYERRLLSHGFMLLLGWLSSAIFPYVIFWSWSALLSPNEGQRTALIVVSLAFLVSQLVTEKIKMLHPGGRAADFITQTILITYGLFALLTLSLHIVVSRYLLISSGICGLLWTIGQYFLENKYTRLKLAVIPGGRYTEDIVALMNVHQLTFPLTLDTTRYDGVVADLDHSDAATQRFLAQCALNRTAVYDECEIYESLSGRVKIQRISENKIGALRLPILYEALKRCYDIAIVIVTLPLTLIIGAVVAMFIKLESPGPVIYSQMRVGQGNRLFTMYKFRSMYQADDAAPQFAVLDDPRITRVGRIVRKMRIDELPQFFNVLKGDMSLIGPRPEQPSFVAEYEEQIPFYSYRHIAKPGVTGWAQVRHGYTASGDETIVKLEYDFYYIKHYSFTLDFVIVLMTLRIILSGFGAR